MSQPVGEKTIHRLTAQLGFSSRFDESARNQHVDEGTVKTLF